MKYLARGVQPGDRRSPERLALLTRVFGARGVEPSEQRRTQRPLSTQRLICCAAFAVVAFPAFSACGKKGPPLPPLVRVPQPPQDLVAERRGNTVDVHFTVPSTNTDGTRPANVATADVYAITAPVTLTPLTDAQVLKLGTKIGSVPVKAKRRSERRRRAPLAV